MDRFTGSDGCTVTVAVAKAWGFPHAKPGNFWVVYGPGWYTVSPVVPPGRLAYRIVR
jgi:hypothetical protein